MMIIEGMDVRMKVKAYIASAFSKDNVGGNQAGIIFFTTTVISDPENSHC